MGEGRTRLRVLKTAKNDWIALGVVAVLLALIVLEGIFLGIIGAIIPLTLLYFLYIRAIRLIVENFSVLGGSMRFLSVAQIYRTLLPIGLLLGIGIGWIGSFLTTRKHLRV